MEIKKTVTSIFMVPTLNISREKLKKNGFINGYSTDDGKDVQYEGCIYLLFRPDKLDAFRDFLDEEYERTKSIIDDYDYSDGYVVLVYALDKKFRRDFGFIREGLYSRTSPEFQKLFPKVVKILRNGLHKDEISLQYRIFNKTEDLRQYWENKIGVDFDESMEVWGGFYIENETLTIDKIKEYV
jgi:hypothetical protein